MHEHVAAALGEVERGDGVREQLGLLARPGRAVQPGELEVAGRGQRLLLVLGPSTSMTTYTGTPGGMRGSEAEIAGMTLASPASRCQSASGSGV